MDCAFTRVITLDHINIDKISPPGMHQKKLIPTIDDLKNMQAPKIFMNKLPPPRTQPFHIPTPKMHIPPHYSTPPPIYMYPNNNIRLPYIPLGSYPMPSMIHIFDMAGEKLNIDNLITGKDKKVWLGAVNNKLGRLSQELPQKIIVTSTINFIF